MEVSISCPANALNVGSMHADLNEVMHLKYPGAGNSQRDFNDAMEKVRYQPHESFFVAMSGIEQLGNRPVSLVDRSIRVRAGGCIGIRNRDSA